MTQVRESETKGSFFTKLSFQLIEIPLLGLFNGRKMTYYGRWTYKYEEAARHGAQVSYLLFCTSSSALVYYH